MYKIIKGFFLANGFEGVAGETSDLKDAKPSEIKSLIGDGSIEETKETPKKTKK